ncbi:unnamed protein product [Mytilus coruscus]|uniref:DDE Tnp4 domain-containing protein n=1 Tax=Mytilus coruscus TaxID=42192 RepID=A0A6J8CAL1_MYTCO|nr:unnamed protein product [Mytilus coruscus]
MIFIFPGYPDSEIKLTGRVPTKLDLSMTSADFNHKLYNMFPVLMDVVFELMTAIKSKLESLPSYINTPALIKDLMSKEGRSCDLRSFPCVLCQKRTKPGERRYICGDAYNGFRKYLFKNFMIKVQETDVSCSRCRNKYYRSHHASSNTVSDDVVYQPPAKKTKQDLCSPKHISLPLQSVKGPSHSSCYICKRRGVTSFKRKTGEAGEIRTTSGVAKQKKSDIEAMKVLTRGKVSIEDFLHELGIETEVPTFLKKGEKQHDVEDSNSSRLTTKIRWKVESANGRMKQWKYLANVVPNSQIPNIGEDLRLVCAISNKYLKPLCSSNETDELSNLSKQNTILMERVKHQE